MGVGSIASFVSRLTIILLSPIHILYRCSVLHRYWTLVVTWSRPSPTELVAKMKRYLFCYAVDRHKMWTVALVYHTKAYSLDDSRFDR